MRYSLYECTRVKRYTAVPYASSDSERTRLLIGALVVRDDLNTVIRTPINLETLEFFLKLIRLVR